MGRNEFFVNGTLISNNEDIYIWINDTHREYKGAQNLFDYFLKKNIYVKGFVTDAESMISLKMYNKNIYDIRTLDKKTSIVFYDSEYVGLDAISSSIAFMVDICSGEYREKIYANNESEGMNKEVVCIDAGLKKRLFSLEAFWMFNHFVGKRIYIYGVDDIAKEFMKYLKLLDFDFAGFLVDDTDEIGLKEKHPIQYVEEILYEENWYVWVYDRRKAKKLKDLGFVYFKDYYVRDYRFDITIQPKSILDINLGHNYLSGSKYSGFMVYGDEKPDNFKIVVLGGSTTDGTMYPFKSWPQLLYEELGAGEITIYNGGVCSYTSGQELIKLIRDVLQLMPDMIIVYDGYNDLAFNVCAEYPFTSLYLEEVFEYARVHIDDKSDYYLEEKDSPVCRGIASRQTYFYNWLSNMRTMYAIAHERDISFFSFCQPVLSSKKRKTLREKNMLLSMASDKIELLLEESFRRQIEQLSCKPDYIYDLSHIFDEMDEVYMDVCHVWEHGNRIIAQEIKKVIQSELVDII